MSLHSLDDVKVRMRSFLDEGIVDPFDLADKVFPEVDPASAMTILRACMHTIAREVLRGRRTNSRHNRRTTGDGAVFGVHVPGIGWKSERELTADDCEEVANDYERRGRENLFYAQEYRRLAREIREGGVTYLGELEEYFAQNRERTKEGLRRAKEAGVVLGRPVRAPKEMENKLVFMYREEGSYTRVAKKLNEEGYKSVEGGQWYASTVKQMLNRLGVESAGMPPRGELKTHCVHGHEYTEENTFRNAKGARECKTCIRDRRESRRKK